MSVALFILAALQMEMAVDAGQRVCRQPVGDARLDVDPATLAALELSEAQLGAMLVDEFGCFNRIALTGDRYPGSYTVVMRQHAVAGLPAAESRSFDVKIVQAGGTAGNVVVVQEVIEIRGLAAKDGSIADSSSAATTETESMSDTSVSGNTIINPAAKNVSALALGSKAYAVPEIGSIRRRGQSLT